MALLFLCWPWAQAQAKPEPVPAIAGWVTDTTGTLSPDQKDALNQQLKAVEQEKGAQVVILMVPTTGEETIEQYALRVFDQWEIGRKKVDDGILLLVAKDDRRMRIQTGYGLEGAVTDLQAGRIIRVVSDEAEDALSGLRLLASPMASASVTTAAAVDGSA